MPQTAMPSNYAAYGSASNPVNQSMGAAATVLMQGNQSVAYNAAMLRQNLASSMYAQAQQARLPTNNAYQAHHTHGAPVTTAQPHAAAAFPHSSPSLNPAVPFRPHPSSTRRSPHAAVNRVEQQQSPSPLQMTGTPPANQNASQPRNQPMRAAHSETAASPKATPAVNNEMVQRVRMKHP